MACNGAISIKIKKGKKRKEKKGKKRKKYLNLYVSKHGDMYQTSLFYKKLEAHE